MPQELKRLAGAAFLHEADQGVDAEQHGDDRCLTTLAEQNLKQDGRFQHPGDRPPKLLQKRKQRMVAPLRNLVRPILLQATLRLSLGQAERVYITVRARRTLVHGVLLPSSKYAVLWDRPVELLPASGTSAIAGAET